MENKNNLTAKSSITVRATPEQVWEALTNPAMVKQYLFGTDMKTDWKEGSDITYSGMWDGKPYEDRGTVLQFVPNRLIEMSYWSQAFGPDLPENRKKVTYEITPKGEETMLTITQDNEKTEEGVKHSEVNWNMVLDSLKKLVEK